jgi:hypothetical protein
MSATVQKIAIVEISRRLHNVRGRRRIYCCDQLANRRVETIERWRRELEARRMAASASPSDEGKN